MGFLSIIPLQYRIVAYVVIALALIAFGWVKGNDHGSQKLFDYQAKEAAEAVRIVTARGQVTERVVTKYVKVAGETKVITQTIEKEVYGYANTGFTLDADWRRLHDAAALNRVPAAPGGADGAPSAAQSLATVSSNYGACHAAEDQLEALQDWVKAQAGVK